MRLLHVTICSLALLLLTALPVRAETGKLPAIGEQGIPARVISVYDGDTMTVEAQVWPDMLVHARVRLAGIDAPEMSGKCLSESRWAASAHDRLLTLAATQVWLRHIRHDRYGGRVVAEVFTADGQDIAALMLESGHARPYSRGKRKSWCPEAFREGQP